MSRTTNTTRQKRASERLLLSEPSDLRQSLLRSYLFSGVGGRGRDGGGGGGGVDRNVMVVMSPRLNVLLIQTTVQSLFSLENEEQRVVVVVVKGSIRQTIKEFVRGDGKGGRG